ncbi:MAG TPA: peptidoglycan bridge formation glycyltransferase FemA/FemB family protein [Anaerolineae bacterium]|nr:peptidoglycan bridge formation glycyltransferase FemA/FemB family protein [Anaerolineae bacterium]
MISKERSVDNEKRIVSDNREQPTPPNPLFTIHYPLFTDSLLRLPNPHVLQGWEWGDFKSRWGWQPTRLLWQDADGKPAAAAQVLRRAIPKTPWSMLYVSKGPIWDYTNLNLTQQILADLEAYARQQKALFIKIDPDVPLAFDPAAAAPHAPGLAVKKLLQTRGWRYSPQQIQFKNTVLIDLRPTEEDLLAAMKSKWRYNIRLARRKGVTIWQGGVDDLEAFYQLYAVTGQRNGFLIRPKAYYFDLWRQYLSQTSASKATLLLARVNNAPVAGLMLFHFGKTAWYLYGASDNKHRNLMPNHLLQWEAIRLAKAAGRHTYDMWGAPDVFDESDSMWGVYKFKIGFGGLTRQGLGAYDYPVHALKYQAYIKLLPRLLAILKGS